MNEINFATEKKLKERAKLHLIIITTYSNIKTFMIFFLREHICNFWCQWVESNIHICNVNKLMSKNILFFPWKFSDKKYHRISNLNTELANSSFVHMQ